MYKLTKEGNFVIRLSDNACIPMAAGNRDYAEYLEWLSAGNAPEPHMTPEAEFAALVQEKANVIQAEKKRGVDGGVMVDGVLFDSDQAARMAFIELGQRLAVNPAYSTRWKASMGVWVTMDAAMFAAVNAAGEVHVAQRFAWQEARDAEIAAAVALAETDLYAAKTALEAVGTAYSAT